MGFCLLSNTGLRQDGLHAIVHRIVQQQLGLKQIEWGARYLELTQKLNKEHKEQAS